GVQMTAVRAVAPYFLAACLLIALMARWLSVMQLGEEKAKTMGVPTNLVTFGVWLATAVLAACAISVAGPVMFAGFLAAYLARSAVGPRFGAQLLISLVFGMTLVLAADLCGRLVIQPYE